MAAFKFEQFSGVVPRTSPVHLEDNQAQIAKNLKLQSGDIRPWRSSDLVYSPSTTGTKTIYKFQAAVGTTPVWLEWTSDVDVVPGPVADLTDFRLYFTSDSFGPRKTNWALATGSGAGAAPYPNAWYELGVPAPTVAPTVSAAGTGAAPVETRSYVYTYVTVFGAVSEESAPSPATNVNANYSGDAVTISGFGAPPSGNYNFQYKRIYRSVLGASSAGYQLVAEVPVSTTSYVDTKSVLDLGVSLPSLYYTPPPSGLRGLIAMPNGILAGFVGNQVWFCEPYLPHAWPVNYMLTTDYPIVGLGVFGNTLVVGTTRNPYIITGTTPTAMAQDKLPLVQPCVSKRSIASDESGVMYASPNGLVGIGGGSGAVITTALYTRDEWQAINPASLIGALYNNMYFGFYNVSGVYNSVVLLRGDNPPLVNFDASAKGVFVEPTTGTLHILSATDNKIYSLDTNTSSNTSFQWKSKKFLFPKPMNIAIGQVHADYAYMAAHSGSSVTINVYADDSLVYTGNPTSDLPFRFPAGTRAYVWEFEILGNVPVRRVNVATTMGEIAGA